MHAYSINTIGIEYMCVCHCEVIKTNDPKQIPFLFGDDLHSQAYYDGQQSGLFWDASWMPGGPFHWKCSPFSNSKDAKMAQDSQVAYDNWHAGFEAGLQTRLEVNSHFRQWWNINKGCYPLRRYIEPSE